MSIKFLTVLIFSSIVLLSCNAKTEAQKKLGVDSDYFIGLKLLEENNQKAAISRFKKCAKKGSYYCAKASAQKLCEFGSLQDRNNASINLLKKFNDSDSLLLACNQFYESNEINKLIEFTSEINFETENNEIIRLRLEALKKRNDSSFEKSVYLWFTCRPISQEHYKFYRDFYPHPDFDSETENYTPEQFALNFRIELYKRNYIYTFENANRILTWFDSNELIPNPQLASDIGKSYLYGSMKFANNAALFKSYAEKYTGKSIEYYFWFYAGRLFDKANLYITQSQRCFEKAIETAQDSNQKDTAIWYLLDTGLNLSLKPLIKNLEIYAKQWSKPSYFDDFFETLITTLLISGEWDTFYDIYTIIDGYASNEIVAQMAYIYGRLCQEKLATPKTELNQIFERALNSDSSIYYKILSAQQLQLTDSEVEKLLYKTGYTKKTNENTENSFAAEQILTGCVLFGFPQMIYPIWKEINANVSLETSIYLSEFLRKCSTGEDDYYHQSLRIAAKAASSANRTLKKDELCLLYPDNYLDFIDTSCKKYDVKKSVVFAMIRSESFFDPDVISSAGAIGLTQLMELTSGDIARRLKYKEYSLEDPQTNIDFGTYYLATLINRCNGSNLQAFFSYNAGITRVRRWLQSSLVEFGKKSEMPIDLFLETVPFAETREYGRKLVSAGVMYEWLYDDTSSSFLEIVSNFVK